MTKKSVAYRARSLLHSVFMRWAIHIVASAVLAGAAVSQEPTPEPSPEAASPAPEASPAAEPAASPAFEGAPLTLDTAPGSEATDMPTGSDTAPLAPVVEDVISIDQTPDLSLPDDALVDPNALLPPDSSYAPPPAVVVESAAEKLREITIRYREVRIKADADPKVVSLREQAEAATSLEGKRAALREYYRLLFKKVASIDKSLTKKAELMEEAYIRRLAQTRIEPTIPLNPPPTPEPLN